MRSRPGLSLRRVLKRSGDLKIEAKRAAEELEDAREDFQAQMAALSAEKTQAAAVKKTAAVKAAQVAPEPAASKEPAGAEDGDYHDTKPAAAEEEEEKFREAIVLVGRGPAFPL